MTDRTRPAQRPEGRLIQAAARGVAAAALAPLADISASRWRHIVNGYQPVGGGQEVAIVAPPMTLARMAQAVGVIPEQLEAAGREDAAEILRDLLRLSARAGSKVETPPLPRELDDLIAVWLAADPDDREVIQGQVRFLLRAFRPDKERY